MEDFKKDWINHNQRLQNAYNRYSRSRNQKEKDQAARLVQEELMWGPFEDYIAKQPLSFLPDSIVKYGIDSVTERCISDIDKIARGLMDIPDL